MTNKLKCVYTHLWYWITIALIILWSRGMNTKNNHYVFACDFDAVINIEHFSSPRPSVYCFRQIFIHCLVFVVLDSKCHVPCFLPKKRIVGAFIYRCYCIVCKPLLQWMGVKYIQLPNADTSSLLNVNKCKHLIWWQRQMPSKAIAIASVHHELWKP